MVKALAIFVALIFSVGGAFAATMETGSDASVPAVVTDTSRPRYCTIAYVTVDSATNDVFMARMEVDPAQTDQAANGLYPCPRDIPARLATRALEPCLSRVVDGKTCVFGDMSRGFEKRPDGRLTAENTSRCPSDVYSHIGVACVHLGDYDVCNVACGNSEETARDAARGRCETKQQQICTIAGSAPILPPQ